MSLYCNLPKQRTHFRSFPLYAYLRRKNTSSRMTASALLSTLRLEPLSLESRGSANPARECTVLLLQRHNEASSRLLPAITLLYG